MKYKTYPLIVLFACLYLQSLAQGDSTFLTKASKSLSDHISVNPIEKVYLHCDRPYYYGGDTIWFKAYTVIGEHHQLSALSGVLYCELINSDDSVVVRHLLKLTAGITWNNFVIPRSYKPGNYHIRAYTNWMRNAGPEYFFNQSIRIIGPQRALKPVRETTDTNKPDIRFFPEGGELVEGVRSRVAVKSVNSNGFGEDINGVIVDNDGNEVTSFTTLHLGMGAFALTPQPGKTYKANITRADSSKLTIDLPVVHAEGFTLTINNNNADSVYVKVAANDKMFQAAQNTVFYLVAQSAGKVYYTAESKLSAPVFTTRIAKSRFPSGIVQFTLFSQSGEPLNERIIFIQNNDGIKLTLSSPAQTYSTRQKVKIDINTKNDTVKAATGSFSVAVINESRVPENENAESTILNNLLLTSDLKGYIEQPNYYFADINDQKRADLDLLMLTQGYRSFEWKKVLNTPANTTTSTIPTNPYQPETDLHIEGTLKTPSGKPLPKSKITLVATKDGLATDTVADVNGLFRFSGLTLSDTAKIILRARKANNGSNINIYVKQRDYPAVIKSSTGDETDASLTPEMLKNIADYQQQNQDSLKGNRQLKEVKIKAKRGPRPDRYNEYGTALEYDADMKKLRAEQIVTSQALTDVIQGLVYSEGRFAYHQLPVRIIIDGVVRKQDAVDFMSPNELESVRVVDAVAGKPITMVLTTKRYAGTDTASTVMLNTVTVNGKKGKVKPDLSASANRNGPGNANQVIMGDNLSDGCINLSDCLTGRLAGVLFKGSVPYLQRAQNKLGGSPAMSVIIDGMIMDGTHLNDVSATDVYSIEVLRSGAYLAIYGSGTSGGAIVITTRRGSSDKFVTSAVPAGLITYPFQGYHKARVFYSPKYDHPKTETEPFDSRTTIYWNPNIITDKDGKASFEYYNADTKGTYRVVVEGIDEDGKLGRAVYRYQVQ